MAKLLVTKQVKPLSLQMIHQMLIVNFGCFTYSCVSVKINSSLDHLISDSFTQH